MTLCDGRLFHHYTYLNKVLVEAFIQRFQETWADTTLAIWKTHRNEFLDLMIFLLEGCTVFDQGIFGQKQLQRGKRLSRKGRRVWSSPWILMNTYEYLVTYLACDLYSHTTDMLIRIIHIAHYAMLYELKEVNITHLKDLESMEGQHDTRWIGSPGFLSIRKGLLLPFIPYLVFFILKSTGVSCM